MSGADPVVRLSGPNKSHGGARAAVDGATSVTKATRQPCPRCGHKVCTCIEDTLAGQMRMIGLPEAHREYVFWPGRRFRFDFAYPDRKIAIECDGGTWSGGRHTRGKGFEQDCEKMNLAALANWRVYRFTAAMVSDGRALQTVEIALKGAE